MIINDSTYYTKHTILTSPHHITYTNGNGTKNQEPLTHIYITYSKLHLVHPYILV